MQENALKGGHRSPFKAKSCKNRENNHEQSSRKMKYTDNETYRRIHFAIMAIESGARKLGISGKEMHDRLKKQGLIHRRLINKYEDLHTQSLDWVADDISETLLNWEAGA